VWGPWCGPWVIRPTRRRRGRRRRSGAGIRRCWPWGQGRTIGGGSRRSRRAPAQRAAQQAQAKVEISVSYCLPAHVQFVSCLTSRRTHPSGRWPTRAAGRRCDRASISAAGRYSQRRAQGRPWGRRHRRRACACTPRRSRPRRWHPSCPGSCSRRTRG